MPIAANLRHDQLDARRHRSLAATRRCSAGACRSRPALREPLSFLFRLAQHLKAQREVVRGKPENFNRPDYNFRLRGNDGGEPTGDEQVQITMRRRGAPLDLIVAEAMILANSTWGGWLAELRRAGASTAARPAWRPASRCAWAPRPLPHAGIGVKSYAWSTSPLRRYTDLVNQWQIIAAARHGRTAALAAPFKPKDAELFSIISGFDAAYCAYNGYQAGMERFWTLKYLQQQGMQRTRGHRRSRRPGARRRPAAGAAGAGRERPAARRARAGALGDIDLITLDVRAPSSSGWSGAPAATRRRRRRRGGRTVRRPDCDRRRCHRRGRGGTGDARRAPRRRANPSLVNLKSLSTLQIALGVSVAVHAALLTVRFVDPEGFNRVFQDTPLEVVLVNATTNEKPDKAQAIAQASLAGGGEAEKGRATSPLPPSALTDWATPPKTQQQEDRGDAGAADADAGAGPADAGGMPPPDPKQPANPPKRWHARTSGAS